jgi:hypothetical protein
MMAGHVFVFMDPGGNLQIIGDNRANGIQVDRFGDTVIQGIDAGGSATRINGVPNGLVEFEVVGEGDIKVHFRGGNDIVRVGERSDDVLPPDDLEIDTGSGNDEILITGDTNIGDDLEIDSGPGNDLVDVRNADVADNTVIETGSGDDVVKLLAVRIAHSTWVNTGDGADRIYTEFEATFGGSLRIDTGRGDDFLQLTRANFEGRVHVRMGAGNDGLCIENATFNSEDTWFDGGRGRNDTWAINAAVFAGEPLLGDITPRFEFSFDDCTFFEHFDPDPVSD